METHNYRTYEPSKQCAKCKGECCKKMPGHYSPTDFKDLSFEGLKAEIEKGGIAIDWWENESREYYLRARHHGEAVVHGSWGGCCVNLTPTGCSLSWDARPLGCRNLKPRELGSSNCVGTYTKEQCKNDWKAYDETLNRLVEHFNQSDDTFDEFTMFMERLGRLFI